MKKLIIHTIAAAALLFAFSGSMFSQIPILTTTSVSNINPNSAQSGGNITSDGGNTIIVSGVCWSTSPNPTTVNNSTFGYTTIGSFTSLITGLIPNTTYYVKAFARNSAGTAYGDEKSFTTLPITPVVFNPNLTYGTITDIDGNAYKTIQIGTQLWMAENLRVTHYNDGSGAITFVPSGTSIPWSNLENTQTPGYCFYNDNDQVTYGALYNWYAVNTNKLCPVGWYVPTDGDWTILTNLFGGSIAAGASLKEAGTMHWPSPNTSNNSSGFSANPGGYRDHIGGYYGLTTDAFFWSTTIAAPTTFRDNLQIKYNNDNAYFDGVFSSQGSSVRCLKEYPPTIETYSPSSVTPNSAQSGGSFVSTGNLTVEQAGVCWSTSPNPTIAGNHTFSDVIHESYFQCTFSGLTPNTKYYIRPFATNSAGTGYGNELSFTTTCNVIDLSTYNLTDVTCYGGSDGNIWLAATGYTYAWTGPNGYTASTQNITNIKAGNYSVTVSDAYGCKASTNFTIAQPPVLSATVTSTNVTCHGQRDGTIIISGASGGSGAYEYSINGGSYWTSDWDFVGLDAGSYNILIRDAAHTDCMVTLNGALVITQPDPLTAPVTWTNVTCNGANDGAIYITDASGGYGNYLYSINGSETWQGDGNFTGLAPHNYVVEIRDADHPNCVVMLNESLNITQPDPLSATLASTNVTCNGANDGKINITNPTGGYGTFEYTINGGGSWQASGNFTALIPGFYNVQVRDAANISCVIILNGSLQVTQPAALSAFVSSTNVTCNGVNDGKINITSPSGGHGTFEYRLGTGSWQSSGSFTGLGPAAYNVQIRDAAHTECIVILNSGLSITQPDVLNASGTVISQSCNSCNDAKINLTVSGGTLPYSYAWTGPDGYSSTTQNIASLKPGSYRVVVMDAHGCSKTVYFEVLNPFVVTNNGDANEIGSLRYAINYANGHFTASPNLITFNIPFGLPSTIQPGIALPDIVHPLVIDGYSEPGASFTDLILSIELEGTKAGAGSNGLRIESNNCTIKGLIIDGFSGNGIQVYSGTGNMISANSIFNNGALGIDLGTNGAVTPNDAGDVDTGPNNLQNFPVLTSVNFSPGNVKVSGSLNSTKSALSYKLEFFANKVADNNGYGEGQTYLGSTTVTTNNSTGNATFTVTLPTMTKYGDVITSTATDPSGNTSEFSQAIGGLQNQILASSNIPFHYKINQESVRIIDNATICKQIQSAFGNWSGIATSSMSFIYDGTTASKYASASDNINLVSFKDDKFPFSPGILAVTAKTLKIGATDAEAQIIDADIVFNPYYVNNSTYNFGITDNPLYAGFFDIQSIATHEIGHVLGLLHSGVYNATMWFEIRMGIDSRSLEQDDKSWLSYRYPNKTKYNAAFGSISGNIKYGYNNDLVAGAIVLAVNPATNLPVVHAYSDVKGNYLIPGVPPGTYRVYIMPLNGDVYGRDLTPANISPYIYANTIYTDYPGEFYNNPDGADDSGIPPTNVTVSAGKETSGINFITNIDKTPPTVKSVVPADGTSNVSVLPDILITFSEPVDMNTVTGQSCYLTKAGSTTVISGNYQTAGFEENSDIILFTLPKIALDYDSYYTLHITSAVTDLKTNHLATEKTSTFHTEVPDVEPPTIKSTIPINGAANVFLTDKIMVFFSEPMIKSSVESSFILTTDNGTIKVDCTPSWDEYSTFTLSPKSPLIEGKQYFLTWTNMATDLSGNGLAAGSINFKTILAAVPTITYLEPGSSLTTNVAVETAIVVDFSEPINTTTINSTTFKLLVGTSTQQVSGSFEFLNDNSRVVFRPAANLSFGQKYTINLTTGIKDVSKAIGTFGGKTTTFTTGTKPSKPHIDYIDPPSGQTGSRVIIGGSGFDPNPLNNKVTFTAFASSGVDAFAVSASLTSLTVIVPYGAVSGNVRVTTNGVLDDQDASNLSVYFYIVSNTDPCNTAYGSTNTGSNPHSGALSYDGATAYVTNYGGNTVSVIANLDKSDPLHNEPYELTRIQVGTSPMEIAIDPTGTKAYVTNFNSHNVSVIDLTNNSVITTINVGVNPYGIVVNGDKVYVANYGSNNITVINVDPASGGFDRAVANINTGTQNRDIGITPDGGLLVVTGNNGLTLIKIMQTALGFDYAVSNSNPGSSTRNAALTTDAGTAIVTTMAGDIFFVDIAPGDNFGAAYGNYNGGSPAGGGKTSYDGLYYYVTNPGNEQVTVYKITHEGSGSGSGTVSSSSGLALKYYATIPVGKSPESLAIDRANDRLIVVNSGSNNITEVLICCPASETALDLIKDMVFPITQMMNGNAIQRLLGSMLIGRLNDAANNIIRGKPKTAIINLNTFILIVKVGSKFPINEPYIAADLIKTAQKIISMLQNPVTSKSVMSESTLANTEQVNQDMILVSKLGVIYPNPFSQTVTINYQVAENNEAPTKVQIMIYDINGKLVGSLVDEMMQQGCYTATWKGTYDDGTRAPYGTYFVLFRTGGVEEVSKIVLIKPR
jgi:uncharacterized protein (TIGR02145 family)